MTTTAEAIIFAINAAIRLGRNTQLAYAQSIKARAIVLPLPKFPLDRVSETLAISFFDNTDESQGGAQFVANLERLQHLHLRARDLAALTPLNPNEWKEYLDYFVRFYKTLLADRAGELPPDQINAQELSALLRIRQWEKGQALGTRPLQMVAGTLVEIGIDYFSQVPGAPQSTDQSGARYDPSIGSY
ncbi:MAG: hypothetical protein HC821_00055 [Lewinella sp.]|nr:hypothetical protein [Lewinella sp.]